MSLRFCHAYLWNVSRGWMQNSSSKLIAYLCARGVTGNREVERSLSDQQQVAKAATYQQVSSYAQTRKIFHSPSALSLFLSFSLFLFFFLFLSLLSFSFSIFLPISPFTFAILEKRSRPLRLTAWCNRQTLSILLRSRINFPDAMRVHIRTKRMKQQDV